jgi:hypothetical protein
MPHFRSYRLKSSAVGLFAALAMMIPSPAQAQVQTVDPNAAIDGDLTRAAAPPAAVEPSMQPATVPVVPPSEGAAVTTTAGAETAAQDAATDPATAVAQGGTYKRDDLLGAAEGVFGQGAHGLAGIIEDLLRRQGEPNGYIVGREGGAALGIGLRYGSGTLYHKVEGQRPVYWTGPSIGFDAGANAASTFVLVYNLYNTDDLYHRFAAGEGQAYIIGGFNVSYVRRGNVVLIPIRMGAGVRLGVNAGYLKFSAKQRWLPF